jgi:hypothetical protein
MTKMSDSEIIKFINKPSIQLHATRAFEKCFQEQFTAYEELKTAKKNVSGE